MRDQLARVFIVLLAAVAVVWSALTFPHAATSNSVLFDREVVRILNAHCAMCHMNGGPAESLVTWEETWLQRDAIHDAVLARHMPPWAAVAGYGTFKNANQLTLREKRFIVSWVEGLGPRNNGELFLNVPGADGAIDEPVTAEFDTTTWRLGEPDRLIPVLPVEVGGAVVPGTDMQWINTYIDMNIQEEYTLTGLEFLPEDRSRLHAVVFSLSTGGQWLATWTPWYGFREFPGDSGIHVAFGERLNVDYLVSGRDTQFLPGGSLGLHLDSPPPTRPLQEVRLEGQSRGERLQLDTTLMSEMQITALWPELPRGTASLQVTARHPDGRVQILLLALDIENEWPTSYLLESPVTLPAGTTVTATANSEQGILLGSMRLTLSTY